MPCPEKFKESLVLFGLDPALIGEINEGYEALETGSKKKDKAAYFARAIALLDARADAECARDLLEWNACCKSGSREKAAKAFAKKYADASLDERLAKIPSVPHMGVPTRNADGTITVDAVRYFKEGCYHCGCPSFNGVKRMGPVSKHYCYCCAGHFKYHYEILLGVKLKTVEIVSSPLDTDGKEPCAMRFQVLS